MATRLSHSSIKQLTDEVMDVGTKLLQLPSSTAEIIHILAEVEQILFRVPQSPSRLVIKALDQIITALIAKELLIHPDVEVNISVACCICDVLAITTPYNHKQMREFFQLVVVTFEKLTSTCGGCYTKMMKVLETLSSVQFMELMSKCLQLDGLIVRLFKQFISVADSNSSAVVSKMEQIMTMLMGESEELDELAGLLTTSVKKEDQNSSPVSCQLEEKVLKNCARRLSKPHRPDMSVRRCQKSQSDEKREKSMLSSDDPPTPSKAVKELNGKRKRDDMQVQSVEHGENLVGERIKVWWPTDKKYYEGLVESFDCGKKKHTVSYDNGVVKHLDLKQQRWELIRKLVMGLPAFVSSPQSGVPRVRGSTVKNIKGQQWELVKGMPSPSISSVSRCQHSQSEKKRGKNMLSSDDPPKPSKAVKELNGKLKRDDKKVQCVEHGENLVGERIKVWWPADKKYYEGVVESFDCSEKKHTVLYDDGDIEHLDLKEQQWKFVRELVMGLPAIVSSSQSGVTRVRGSTAKNIKGQQWELAKGVPSPSISLVLELPATVSSPQSGVTCVQGYTVKNINAPILESIFKKHGDIAATCVFKTSSARESILDIVCEVVRKIQTSDVTAIISDMEELLSQVSGAEAIKINVAWLRAHLEAIHKRTEANLLMKMSANTSLVTRAAEMDLKEIMSEFATVQERLEKAKRCVEVLNLVKKKLNDKVLEWKADKDSWAEQPML